MTLNNVRLGLVTAGVVTAVGAITVANAASNNATSTGQSPGGYAVSQCGDGKWQTYTNPDGTKKFKNQGQCVSFFVHQFK